MGYSKRNGGVFSLLKVIFCSNLVLYGINCSISARKNSRKLVHVIVSLYKLEMRIRVFRFKECYFSIFKNAIPLQCRISII